MSLHNSQKHNRQLGIPDVSQNCRSIHSKPGCNVGSCVEKPLTVALKIRGSRNAENAACISAILIITFPSASWVRRALSSVGFCLVSSCTSCCWKHLRFSAAYPWACGFFPGFFTQGVLLKPFAFFSSRSWAWDSLPEFDKLRWVFGYGKVIKTFLCTLIRMCAFGLPRLVTQMCSVGFNSLCCTCVMSCTTSVLNWTLLNSITAAAHACSFSFACPAAHVWSFGLGSEPVRVLFRFAAQAWRFSFARLTTHMCSFGVRFFATLERGLAANIII